jgi:hypothetical protein
VADSMAEADLVHIGLFQKQRDAAAAAAAVAVAVAAVVVAVAVAVDDDDDDDDVSPWIFSANVSVPPEKSAEAQPD